ncbi:SWIM zinc finger family protein [Candidatus Uabimicrobium sp. HlEnr_7]|uniref:SWIM zinc finger family protein n=1 Tax=Candidatus Uabimicrobium helgolandensis TaxID=3095367 RepID=UPI003557069C
MKEKKDSGKTDRLQVNMGYHQTSDVIHDQQSQDLQLACNIKRTPLSFTGEIKETILVREALSALYEIVSSDLRYVPKDRSSYLAYQRMRSQNSNANMWQAQQAYFDWLSHNDPLAFLILDPIISVHPDGLLLEVFSKDEGSYANLQLDWSLFKSSDKPKYGTTNIDFSENLYSAIQKMRSYHETKISIQTHEVKVETKNEDPVIEKKIQVPLSWIRGFLQVQSAATLVKERVLLDPINLYNVLRQLRFNKDKKKGGRAIRIELVPGENIRLVMEPWQKVIHLEQIYDGKMAQVVKLWGRRRLKMLQRILPFASSIHLHLIGSGLPCFMELKAPQFRFTLGLSGFTTNDWTKSVHFDALLPRQNQNIKSLEKIVAFLQKNFVASKDEIVKKTKLSEKDVVRGLQLLCQQGKAMYDLYKYRLRPLTEEDLDLEKLEYRNDSEKTAHDFVKKKLVTIEKENHIFAKGVEVVGLVNVAHEKREYRPLLFLDVSGRAVKAECTCAFYRKNKLKNGPCSHLVALFMQHLIEEDSRQKNQDKITVETRIFSKRIDNEQQIFQVSLDRKHVRKRWGLDGGKLRLQNLVFNSVEEARDVYRQQIKTLESKNYLDTTR